AAAPAAGGGRAGAVGAAGRAGAGRGVRGGGRGGPGAGARGPSAGLPGAPRPPRRDPLATLGRLSRDLYEPLAEALREESGIDIGLGRTGHLRLCMTPAEVRDAKRRADDPAERAAEVTFVPFDELCRLEPAVSQSALGALRIPRGSWVDNVQLVHALVRAGERLGVRYVAGRPVEALVQDRDRITGVRVVGAETIETAAVVVTAGAWSGTIAGM